MIDETVLKEYADKFDLEVELCTIEEFGGWEAAYEKFFLDGGIFDEIYENNLGILVIAATG